MWDNINNRNNYARACGLIILITLFAVINAEASIKNTGKYPGNSFIDPSARIDVDTFSIGSESYIAPFTIFTGESASIGNFSDVQDGGTNSGRIKISDDAVIAHGADLKGDVQIGKNAFIGFNSIITDSKIGDGAYIGVRSIITGVDIPADKSVPAGSVIDSPDDITNLKPVTIAQKNFVNEVIEVNRALATGYSNLYDQKGKNAFGKIGPIGDRDFSSRGRTVLGFTTVYDPSIGKGDIIDNARVIGYVNLGDNVKVGDGTAIRGDEGVPINIGDNAIIGTNNTFHSLNKKVIEIGKDFKAGTDNVIHGPLEVGSNVNVGNRSVVFKSKIGNNVTIGDNAIITGVRLLDGVIIPSDAIVESQYIANKFNQKVKRDIRTEPAWILKLTGGLFFR